MWEIWLSGNFIFSPATRLSLHIKHQENWFHSTTGKRCQSSMLCFTPHFSVWADLSLFFNVLLATVPETCLPCSVRPACCTDVQPDMSNPSWRNIFLVDVLSRIRVMISEMFDTGYLPLTDTIVSDAKELVSGFPGGRLSLRFFSGCSQICPGVSDITLEWNALYSRRPWRWMGDNNLKKIPL